MNSFEDEDDDEDEDDLRCSQLVPTVNYTCIILLFSGVILMFR